MGNHYTLTCLLILSPTVVMAYRDQADARFSLQRRCSISRKVKDFLSDQLTLQGESAGRRQERMVGSDPFTYRADEVKHFKNGKLHGLIKGYAENEDSYGAKMTKER